MENMNDLINKTNELFQYIHPCLRDNFYKLCREGQIGLVPVSINNVGIVGKKLIDSKYVSSFKIQIPYAGKPLTWEIIFDPENLEFAPDFDFNDDGFPQSVDIDDVLEDVPSLVNWNLKNDGSLEAVLKEFLSLYKEYQMKELSNNNIYSRISDEYQLLMSVQGLLPRDVELLIENNSVRCLISIRVDLSNLPEYVQGVDENGSLLNPKEDFALLLMIFHKLDASRVSAQLQLSSRLNQLIGNFKPFRIPSYDKDESSLVEYVPLITDLLQQQISQIAYSCQFKKEFVTSLVALRRYSIIEYDSSAFNKIAFMGEVDNFHVLVQVTFGREFPQERPLVKLCSIYCITPKTRTPCEKILDYKHVPNLPPDEMANHFLEQLKKYIPEFRLHSHSTSPGKKLASEKKIRSIKLCQAVL